MRLLLLPGFKSMAVAGVANEAPEAYFKPSTQFSELMLVSLLISIDFNCSRRKAISHYRIPPRQASEGAMWKDQERPRSSSSSSSSSSSNSSCRHRPNTIRQRELLGAVC
ncbi:hypothetical protein EYF80_000195 [Liparis tanakae]|uniref:Uncharacterized protein n=1 Tax=Liparis tanakae TaxID=230148 RepID=A0A4Z2JK17_9TELE|nr:hypothetical protein EYF80_000195 [Liparis tanakae]